MRVFETCAFPSVALEVELRKGGIALFDEALAFRQEHAISKALVRKQVFCESENKFSRARVSRFEQKPKSRQGV